MPAEASRHIHLAAQFTYAEIQSSRIHWITTKLSSPAVRQQGSVTAFAWICSLGRFIIWTSYTRWVCLRGMLTGMFTWYVHWARLMCLLTGYVHSVNLTVFLLCLCLHRTNSCLLNGKVNAPFAQSIKRTFFFVSVLSSRWYIPEGPSSEGSLE